MIPWVGLAEATERIDLQALLDAAEPGAVVEVPEGVYSGGVRIPDGVALVGAGAGRTILDGEGGEIVVSFGKEAILYGVTVRNGRHGLHNQGNYIGVFECDIEDTSISGLFMQSGSGVILNNIFRGNGSGVGLLISGANPYVANNVFENYAVAVRATHQFIPTLIGNWFRNNRVAIEVSGGTKVILANNVFDGNGVEIRGASLSASDEIRAMDPERDVLSRGHGLAGYRAAMDELFDTIVDAHPAVIYELTEMAGAFDVILLFPWASFTMGASAAQTVILDYHAYDWFADRDLHAERMEMGTLPGVKVDNPEVTELGLDRYVLENRFFHDGSYYVDESGMAHFHRMTTLSRIEIMLPAGYQLVDSNYPAEVEMVGNRQKVAIRDMGVTQLRLAMSK